MFMYICIIITVVATNNRSELQQSFVVTYSLFDRHASDV